jgi:hypothetical protein
VVSAIPVGREPDLGTDRFAALPKNGSLRLANFPGVCRSNRSVIFLSDVGLGKFRKKMQGVRLAAGGWWLVAGGWWLVAGGWWLVAGG